MYNGFIVRDNFKNSKIYDGNTLKFGITIDGEDFIVKSGKNSITSIYSVFYVDIICMRYLHLIERYSLEESYQILRGVKPYEKQKKR